MNHILKLTDIFKYMTSNTSFNQFGSISAQSHNNSHKENNNQSFNSSQSRLKQSVSTHHYTQKGSYDNLNTLKLQSKILEMQKKIDHQKFQIDTLSLQTQNYMNLCEEQKKELSSLNIEMLKQEYEQQIAELIHEKQKLSELIQNISDQYKLVQEEQQTKIKNMKAGNLQLAKRIEMSMNKKQALLEQVKNADRIHKQNEMILLEQQERMDSLRNIERKLFIALKQMESLQRRQ